MSKRMYVEKYGPWAVVVGGSQGLGLAIASQIAARGMNVVITARGAAQLDSAAERLRGEFGVQVEPLIVDAGAADASEKICNALDGKEIGFFVYNCAAEPGGMFVDSTTDQQLQNIAVNCVTPTLLVHRIARDMATRRKGGIVICSSLAAMQGTYNRVIYGAGKAYEMLLGEGLWAELAQHGIGACSFMIGSTYTPNFIRDQKARNTIFAESRIPTDLPAGMQHPQTPDEAAITLFNQIDKEWQPLIFANPLDQDRFEKIGLSDRKKLVERMREMFLSGYRSLAKEA